MTLLLYETVHVLAMLHMRCLYQGNRHCTIEWIGALCDCTSYSISNIYANKKGECHCQWESVFKEHLFHDKNKKDLKKTRYCGIVVCKTTMRSLFIIIVEGDLNETRQIHTYFKNIVDGTIV